MLSVVRGGALAIIGIAALLCANAGLVALGWRTVLAPLEVDGTEEGGRTLPDVEPLRIATRHARATEQDDPVLARPIFFASRKPFEPPPVSEATMPPPPPKPPPPDPVFVVDGIILTGGLRKAHIRQPHEVDGQWYEMGRIIDGWAIVQIDQTGVVLSQEGQIFAMHLYSSDTGAFRIVRQSSR
jgi:hypothetical protein